MQVYTGPHQNPRQRKQRVLQVEDHLEQLAVGCFVAVALSNWKKTPVIGEVVNLEGEMFTIHYWKWSYNRPWEPHNHLQSNQPWTDVLPKNCILLANFELEDNNRIGAGTKKYLQQQYKRLKETVTQ